MPSLQNLQIFRIKFCFFSSRYFLLKLPLIFSFNNWSHFHFIQFLLCHSNIFHFMIASESYFIFIFTKKYLDDFIFILTFVSDIPRTPFNVQFWISHSNIFHFMIVSESYFIFIFTKKIFRWFYFYFDFCFWYEKDSVQILVSFNAHWRTLRFWLLAPIPHSMFCYIKLLTPGAKMSNFSKNSSKIM